ncbi:MAG: DUF4147 domain-containing protein [Rhodobacteraceae bacterium]|nr:DUF4147 domain-containing protein [Paracoccaceae bacterium]
MTAPTKDFTAIARHLFQIAVEQANPARALRAALQQTPLPFLPAGGRTLVLALGKAAVPMMRCALAHVPAVQRALAITNRENASLIEGAELICGAHPIPDASSAYAGRAIVDLAKAAGPRDRLIVLLSGGASALAVVPAAGLPLQDKITAWGLLLRSGMDIAQMNLIRQHLSDLKGGGLARHAAPASVISFVLSDVIGNDLRAIASGPTASALGSRAQACALLRQAGLWQELPASVRSHLAQDTPYAAQAPATHVLIGSNRQSLDAMAQAARRLMPTKVISECLTGDVAHAAEMIVAAAQKAAAGAPVALLAGGETTVRITGKGQGGRNQELALRVALLAQGRLPRGWVFLSGGTDGRDGPTDSAGGLVDAQVVPRIRAAGANPEALLANNDSYTALHLGQGQLITGATGTNVADMQVMLLPGP